MRITSGKKLAIFIPLISEMHHPTKSDLFRLFFDSLILHLIAIPINTGNIVIILYIEHIIPKVVKALYMLSFYFLVEETNDVEPFVKAMYRKLETFV